jgi:hypothetical protein
VGRACSTNGKKGNAYGILVGKPEGKVNQENQDIPRWAIKRLCIKSVNDATIIKIFII